MLNNRDSPCTHLHPILIKIDKFQISIDNNKHIIHIIPILTIIIMHTVITQIVNMTINVPIIKVMILITVIKFFNTTILPSLKKMFTLSHFHRNIETVITQPLSEPPRVFYKTTSFGQFKKKYSRLWTHQTLMD